VVTQLVLFDASRVLVVHGVPGDLGEVLGGVLSIEQRCSFFECQALGLNDEEVDVDKLEGDPAYVDEVVLPSEFTCGG